MPKTGFIASVKRLWSSSASDAANSNELSDSTNHDTITKYMDSHRGTINAGFLQQASASFSSIVNEVTEQHPLVKLPKEILITILSFLKPKELFVAALICKHFNRIITANSDYLIVTSIVNKLPLERTLLDQMRKTQSWPDFYKSEIKQGRKGLHTWGSNEDGVLGIGISRDQLVSQCSPRPVKRLANRPIKHISFIKSASTMVLDASTSLSNTDSVYFCGSERTSYAIPTSQTWKQLQGKSIKKFMFEHRNYVALTNKNELYIWGSNKSGQLFADAKVASQDLPKLVKFDKPVINAIAGRQYTAVLLNDGKVYAVGFNACGKLGVGKEKDTNVFFSGDMSDVNVKIPEKVIKMSFGARHSLFLTESGKLWAAGSNADGQLGNPASVKITSVPIQVNCPPNVRFIKIACGFFHCIALSSTNEVYVWGCNAKGELGIGDDVGCVRVPTKVENVKNVIQIVGAGFHTYCLTNRGEMYGCGYNSAHQVGYQDKNIVKIMSPIPAMKDKIVTKMVAGGFHTGAFVFSKDGSPFIC